MKLGNFCVYSRLLKGLSMRLYKFPPCVSSCVLFFFLHCINISNLSIFPVEHFGCFQVFAITLMNIYTRCNLVGFTLGYCLGLVSPGNGFGGLRAGHPLGSAPWNNTCKESKEAGLGRERN